MCACPYMCACIGASGNHYRAALQMFEIVFVCERERVCVRARVRVGELGRSVHSRPYQQQAKRVELRSQGESGLFQDRKEKYETAFRKKVEYFKNDR